MKTISLSSIKGITLTARGLDDAEVLTQRNKFGTNTILDADTNRWLVILQDTLRDPMMWFLLIVSALFFATGNKGDGLAMLVAVVPLLLMDAFLHWRTKSATISLRKNLDTVSKVIRNGAEKEVNSQEIVPGDLVIAGIGKVIPADGIVELTAELQVDESVLTGESLPVKKHTHTLKQNQIDGEVRLSEEMLVYAGTKVLFGEAQIRIVKTGRHTEYGEIVRSVAEVPNEKTPLQSGISQLLKYLVAAALLFCLLLIVFRRMQGHSWIDSLLAGITLAVAAMPEEFPVVFTFYLGIGVFRLAKSHALVRRAVSVENIGRITHICTDKTGTITEGKLVLAHIIPLGGASEQQLLEAAREASNPESGDPIDLAIYDYQASKNFSPKDLETFRRFPFTEDRRRETAVVKTGSDIMAFSKGAPETMFRLADISEHEKSDALHAITALAEGGHKVLACAVKTLPAADIQSEPSSGFKFLGLLAFEDPARPEVRQAIAEAVNNQIKVLIITGDHPATSGSIARDIGLKGEVISAELQAEKFEPEYLEFHPEFLHGIDVVARCTPKQKLNIVLSLKRQGHLVAVTGDGVNDVPALKAADVAIAMGERGSQSAKEVSSIVLSDDNFKTIITAIGEGRRLFQNMRASFEYLMLIHIPLVICAALIPLGGLPIVFLPIHIVWLELIIHPTAILAFQFKAEKETGHSRAPFFFDKREAFSIMIVGIVICILLSFAFVTDFLNENETVARTKILSGLSLWSVFIVAALTKEKEFLTQVISFLTVMATFLLVQYSETVSPFLHLAPLSGLQWVAVIWPGFMSGLLLFYLKKRKASGVEVSVNPFLSSRKHSG